MKKLIVLLFSVMVLVSAAFGEEKAEAPILEVHQMVLGYADGYYIRCGDVEIMIDGGKHYPFTQDESVLNCLRELGADMLDAYIITHWHLDHCENLNPVLAEFGTPETVVYSPSDTLPNEICHENGNLRVTPLANGVYRPMKMDDVVTIGGLTFTCIGPTNGGQAGRNNVDSLNFVLQYGNRRMLFTGDYAHSGMINEKYRELCSNVDVLKFPHHGSEPFLIGRKALGVTSPTYVLVPCKTNSIIVYNFLLDAGVEIPRENVLTQGYGHVVVLTDGGDYFEVKTQQNPADYAPQAN